MILQEIVQELEDLYGFRYFINEIVPDYKTKQRLLEYIEKQIKLSNDKLKQIE